MENSEFEDVEVFLKYAAKQIVNRKLLAPILVSVEPQGNWLESVLLKNWDEMFLKFLNSFGDDGSREVALAPMSHLPRIVLTEYRSFILMELPPEKVQFDIVRGWGGRTKIVFSQNNPLQRLQKAGISAKQIIIANNLKAFIHSKI